MTRTDVLAQLQAMQRTTAGRLDPALRVRTNHVDAHMEADALLLAWLRERGDGDIVDAYEAARDRVGFYYE